MALAPWTPPPNTPLLKDDPVSDSIWRRWFEQAFRRVQPLNSGTVTSVGLSAPSEFTVSGSPVTTTGTLALSKADQSANTVYAGPAMGADAAPTFRALVANDLPAGTGTVTDVTATAPLSSSGGATPDISHDNSGVTPASYTNANITVDATGHVTAASNGSSGSGTVTSVSVVTANGFAGSVSNPTTTPAITLTTSVTGFLQGNGAAILAASTTGAGSVLALQATPSFSSTIGVGGATASASGAGITFPATQNASSDANTLDDYEEGTWTPIDVSGASLSFSAASGTYEKIGRSVIYRGNVLYPATANASGSHIGGLPFTVTNNNESRGGGLVYANTANAFHALVIAGASTIRIFTSGGVNSTNAQLSSSTVYLNGSYV